MHTAYLGNERRRNIWHAVFLWGIIIGKSKIIVNFAQNLGKCAFFLMLSFNKISDSLPKPL